MTPENALATLMAETRGLIAMKRPLMAFAGPLEGLELALPRPHDLPITAALEPMMAQAAPETAPLTFAVLAAAPHLDWHQSCSEAELGADLLARHGWFDLVGPDGPFAADGLRISFGVWGQGLTCPRHWHAPEEIYCVLAGGARFTADGRDPVEAGAGALVHHPPNLPHAIEMHAAPLLAMAIRKGAGLADRPGIDAPGG